MTDEINPEGLGEASPPAPMPPAPMEAAPQQQAQPMQQQPMQHQPVDAVPVQPQMQPQMQQPVHPQMQQPMQPVQQVVINNNSGVATKGPNHVLHGLLTLFTAGLWAPVWIVIAMRNKQKVIR